MSFDETQGQIFQTAVLPAMPSFTTEGSIYAQFNNGAFQFLSSLMLSNSRTALRHGSMGSLTGQTVNTATGNLTIFQVNSTGFFTHKPTSTTVTFPTSVPEPGTPLLLTIGLVVVGLLRRSRGLRSPRGSLA